MSGLTVPYGEHIALCASTGEGKTFLEINDLCANADRVLVVDSENYDFPEKYFPSVSPQRALGAAKSDKPFRLRVIWPVGERGTAELDSFSMGLLRHGHEMRIVLDEVADFSSASVIGDGLLALVRKGRKRGISVVAGTQRPQNFHKVFPSQARHLLVGYLDEEDQARWRKNSAPPWIEEWLPKIQSGTFRFVYRRKGRPIRILPPAEKHHYAPVPRRRKYLGWP